MTSISGGELVVRTLKEAGVETIFGLHGAHIDTIFQSCLDHELPIIDTRHEAAAGHAAEGYARQSHRLGVALVTAGGGFTNVLTPIANAFLDRTPVLFLTGSGALRDDETNTLQAGFDQVAMATPVTKWAHRITATDQIPRILAQAIRIALSAPRGPVLIDLPWDVLMNCVEESHAAFPGLCMPAPGAVPRDADLRGVLDLLAAAERPVIVVGSEASRSDAADALARFVAASGIPAFADYEGLPLLAKLGDASGGLVQGLYGFGHTGMAPDAVLLLGTRFGLNTVHGSGKLLPLGAKIVQIDPDAREIGRLQSVALGIVAEVGASIEALAESATGRVWPDHAVWRDHVQRLRKERRTKVATSAGDNMPLHPFHAVAAIARIISEDVVVVADGALTYLWLSEVMSEVRPGGFLCHGYLGSMGVGMGMALGAQAAARGKRTILVTGDGAVGYNLGEFDSMVRHELPVIVVVLNNQSWGATLHFQRFVAGPNRVTGTWLRNGSYAAVAAALGAAGYDAVDAKGLEEALAAALSTNEPACIDVRVALDPVPPEEMIIIGQDPF